MDLLNLKPAAAGPRAVTTESFERDVLQPSLQKPVIVDFWATWCGPCRQLMPLLEKAVAAANGAVDLVKVDIDQNPELAQVFRVQSVPTVYAFFQGQPVDGFMGAKPESELKAFVTRLVTLAGGTAPPPADAGAPDTALAKKLTEEGDTFFRAGSADAAMEKYAGALDADPALAAALGGIGWCLLAQGDMDAVREITAQATDAQRDDARIKGLGFIILTADTPPSGNSDALGRSYDEALAHVARGDLGGAIDTLVDLTRRDREWEDQKARKLLLALFDALGPAHPLTPAGRRKLSAVLFA